MKEAKDQTTLADVVELAGKGLFTGATTSVRLYPREADYGIILQRVDLPSKPFFSATVDNVLGTPRCTILGKKGEEIWTVEHLFSALQALQIDNLHIEVQGPEIPIGDGSAFFIMEKLM
ncbi:MAG: UDP-3-O-acyl-N-acetylglucosamine deacetylase, partial [Chlamydiota bacterium]